MRRPVLRSSAAALLILFGLGLFVFGGTWAPAALAFLPDNPAGYWLELVVPFLPMVFVGGGALLLAGAR